MIDSSAVAAETVAPIVATNWPRRCRKRCCTGTPRTAGPCPGARPDPYRTWVSEIMLQQTQVATVIPYYRRFLARFPDRRDARGRRSLRAARPVAGTGLLLPCPPSSRRGPRDRPSTQRTSCPPSDAALLALPGIGDYTAGAILSIAYNQDYVAVDGNVKRILTRLLDDDRPVDTGASLNELTACARQLLPPAGQRL